MGSTLIDPTATPAKGYQSVLLLFAVASPAAVDLSTEIGDAATLNVSLFLRDYQPSFQNNTGFAPARVGTGVQFPQEGYTQFQPQEARYIYDPQADDTTDENKAKAALDRGTLFWVLNRLGPAVDVAYAVGQRYELVKYRAGRQNPGRSGEDEFAELERIQQWFPLTEPVEGVIVA